MKKVSYTKISLIHNRIHKKWILYVSFILISAIFTTWMTMFSIQGYNKEINQNTGSHKNTLIMLGLLFVGYLCFVASVFLKKPITRTTYAVIGLAIIITTFVLIFVGFLHELEILKISILNYIFVGGCSIMTAIVIFDASYDGKIGLSTQ